MCVFFFLEDEERTHHKHEEDEASLTPCCYAPLQRPANPVYKSLPNVRNKIRKPPSTSSCPPKTEKEKKKKAQKNKNRKKNAKKRPNTKEVQYQRHRRCNFLHGRQNKPRKPRRHRAAMTRRDVAPADDKGQGSTAEKHRTLTVIDVRSRPLKPARLRGR